MSVSSLSVIMPNDRWSDDQPLINREPHGVMFDEALTFAKEKNVAEGDITIVNWSYRPGQTKIATWVIKRTHESYVQHGEWIDIQDIDKWATTIQHWRGFLKPTTAEFQRQVV